MSSILLDLRAALKRTFKLVTFRVPAADTDIPGLPTVLLIVLLAFFAGVGLEAYLGGDNLTFNPYGVSAWLAGWAVAVMALTVLGASSGRNNLMQIVMDICMVTLFYICTLGTVFLLQPITTENLKDDTVTLSVWLFCLAALLAIIWVFATTIFMGRVYWKQKRHLPGLRFLIAIILPTLVIPYQPTVYGSATDWSRHDVWELWKNYNDTNQAVKKSADTRTYQPPFDYEAAIYRQRDLVDRVLSGIKKSEPENAPQIYFVAAAPYASQNVFKREVIAVKDLFDTRFGTAGQSALLINHVDTAVTLPMANASNLKHMLNGFAKSMDTNRDVLVLFLTTHGRKGQLSVLFPGYTFNQLTPDTLANILDESGIKNRILIISACHSGSFVQRLENADTIVMTAAHADKTSFGCSNERYWTYFGDAFFNRALRQTYQIEQAFEVARSIIQKWEKHDKLTPSDPQISVGPAMQKKWNEIANRLSSQNSPSLARSLSRSASHHLRSMNITLSEVAHRNRDQKLSTAQQKR